MSDNKANPGGTGMVVATLIAVFVALWMVGKATQTEGEAIRTRLSAIEQELKTLSYGLGLQGKGGKKLVVDKAAIEALAAAQQPSAPEAEPEGEPEAEGPAADEGAEAEPAEDEGGDE